MVYIGYKMVDILLYYLYIYIVRCDGGGGGGEGIIIYKYRYNYVVLQFLDIFFHVRRYLNH